MEQESYQVVSAPAVEVRITSPFTSFVSEKRFNRSITVSELKCKLELIVGSPASCMELQLFSPDDKFIGLLQQDDALLGSYPVDDRCRIHVIDQSGVKIGEFEDVSKVIKYEMSNEAYDKRTDSMRLFLKRSKLGLYNEEQKAKNQIELERRVQEEKALADAILVGARCEVVISGQPSKRGTVMYVGQTDFKPGYWIGLKYDEPLGKHDGSVNGKRYFQCQYKYGAFVKPQSVTVGDYPEEDYGLNDEM
ncbi:tubulin-folding cofactor B [Stegostoma tigrinum]|uniref:tubulin-folding cofactor B n=1 Tax=Stegostoma tigrinum TaxID=3053191 RepID=UPI00202AF3C4|nr:tubulin-folding cofactor B [Stegostoma tigrinum]